MSTFEGKPWESVGDLIQERRVKDLLAFFDALSPQDTALFLSRLDEEERTNLLTILSPDALLIPEVNRLRHCRQGFQVHSQVLRYWIVCPLALYLLLLQFLPILHPD